MILLKVYNEERYSRGNRRISSILKMEFLLQVPALYLLNINEFIFIT